MRTVTQLIDIHGVDVDPHLDRQATIPVCDGLARQGDVLVIPAAQLGGSRVRLPATTPVPAEGVPVVRGEAGGNAHLLLAAGPVGWASLPGRDGSLDIGVVQVSDGATAYLAHPEHGYLGIAPGQYVVRRQREQADVIRVVAD